MAQRTRAYFFGSGGDKFLTGNKPTQPTFQDLLDSCYFKSESGDRATNALYGVSILATTAVSKARSGAGVVLPAHLPVLTYGASNTELVTPGTESYEGIKITAVNKTDRLDYQIDFDPTTLTSKATIAATDFVVIADTADSNKPKKVLVSAFTGGTLWQRTGVILSPGTANDDLDMSGGDVTADSFLLKSATNTYINPLEYTSNNGAALWVSGGAGQHASAAKTGGALYLNPGAGVHGGANGNIYLGWDGSNNMGNIAIRGAVQAGYEFTVHDDAYFDGLVYIKPTAPPGGGVTITTTPVFGSDGNIYYKTFKDFMTMVVGGTVPSGKSLLLYDGSAYSFILTPATLDTFLHTNASTGALEMAVLDMTNRVVNASVATGAAIAWAKMAGLTASRVPQINASGVVEASAIPITALAFLDATSSIQGQLNSVNKSVTTQGSITTTPALPLTAATMKDVFFVDTSSGAVTLTLPEIATLIDGQNVEIHQYAGDVVTLACNGSDAGFVDAVASLAATITIGGAGKFMKLRCDFATKTWVVVAQG